jgi:hypothetical protein
VLTSSSTTRRAGKWAIGWFPSKSAAKICSRRCSNSGAGRRSTMPSCGRHRKTRFLISSQTGSNCHPLSKTAGRYAPNAQNISRKRGSAWQNSSRSSNKLPQRKRGRSLR